MSRKQALALAMAAVFCAPAAFAGAPYPTRDTPKAVDLGHRVPAAGSTITVTVALKWSNTDEMTNLVQQLYAQGSPQYHQFLSSQEFYSRFAPTAAAVQSATQALTAAGLTVTRLDGNLLKATGSQEAIEKAFGVSLHSYEIPAHGTVAAYRYHAPTAAPQMLPSLAASVRGVLGLDTSPRFYPHIRHLPANLKKMRLAQSAATASVPNTPDQPGLWTVTDFADYYDVNPLYAKGVVGKHVTLGIVTLASFTPSDAFTYWNGLGLATEPNRITVVNVDGGPGAPSDASGSDETTLDVEQSGGVAPGAKIIVYAAPNTNQGFVDAFAQAIDNNQADTLSCSWGEWEEFDAAANGSSVTNPNNGQTEDVLSVDYDLFLRAAIQGQSMFASAGDAGAYDANDPRVFPLPQFTKVLSVDSPASQPFVTAAGGTTLPGPQNFGALGIININQEQVWGWDYLTPLCAELGFDPVSCGIFPAGGGGGVSVEFRTPFYQFFLPGVQASQPNQALVDTSQTPPQTLLAMPGNFWGRNVPDVSFNADPDTGYIIPYTSDVNGFEVLSFIGGTSFVAPQLNGMTALLDQSVHGRVGLLNFALYDLVRFHAAYGGKHPPLRDITAGDNWFYNGAPGYDLGSGVGVPDVANLARALGQNQQ